MKTYNLNTPTQFQALTKVIEKANELGYNISEYTEGGYNNQSGYIYLYDENWGYFTLGIADYAFNRGEEVEVILLEPFEGQEFFGSTEAECIEQYKEWAAEELENGYICEDDVLEF